MSEIKQLVFKIDGTWYRIPTAVLQQYEESPALVAKAEMHRVKVQPGDGAVPGLSYVAAYADDTLDHLSAAGGHIDIDPTGHSA